MVHWSKNLKIRQKIIEKTRQSLLKKGNDWLKQRALKAVEARDGSSWNKGLPKKQQPRYGKPVSKNQVEAMRETGKSNKGKEPWNYGKNESLQVISKILRNYFFELKNNKCEICFITNEDYKAKNNRELDIHHINKEIQGKERHNINNLMLICRECHSKTHMTSEEARKRRKGDING